MPTSSVVVHGNFALLMAATHPLVATGEMKDGIRDENIRATG